MPPNPSISLHPATLPHDPLIFSRLEDYVLRNDEFSSLAFGPHRGSEENILARARVLGKVMGMEVENTGHAGERGWRYVKAVRGGESGGEVVGFAAWGIGRVDVEEKGKINEEGKGEEKSGWGIGANVRFCEDTLVWADEEMMKSCAGGDYAKLYVLVISPEYQRQGIGSLLLAEGLKEVDALGLQCVLGASPEGEELYKRFGFEEVAAKELKSWEYEGEMVGQADGLSSGYA
ncbi:hypothetical protein LOCC1_G008771 [Lachnellula occidentalis]|uniref:N-acetyltransferase domain-containing protein n=1 Tax=Lachnellula occidentalis TaxID=215460 RepID=A0A8H8U5P7_9HELO|nr:hypothetical protein LOCC1_G008771 [Lachnellula occidentalis]